MICLKSFVTEEQLLKFKYETGYYTHQFEKQSGYLVMNCCDEVLIVLQPSTEGGYLFQSKTCHMGSNSDLFFWDDMKIEIIGQMFKEGLLEWGEL